MGKSDRWASFIPETVSPLGEEIFLALIIFVSGTALAFLIRKVSFKILSRHSGAASGQLSNFFNTRQIYKFAVISSSALFWITVLVALILTLRPFGIHPLDTLGSQIADYIPKFLAGVVILIAGILLANAARHFLNRSGVANKYASGPQTTKLAYFSVVTVTGFIVTKQLGIDIEFLTSILLVVLGCLLAGASISFGLGSKNLVSNILAAYYLKKIIKVGQMIEGEGYKGRVIEIGNTNILIQTDDGIDVLPSSLMSGHRFRIKNV